MTRLFIHFPRPDGPRAQWVGHKKRRFRTKRLVWVYTLSCSLKVPHTSGSWKRIFVFLIIRFLKSVNNSRVKFG